MASTENFLNFENGDQDEIYEQLLLQANEAGLLDKHKGTAPPSTSVIPKPGFCLKTKSDKDEKVFINICQCDNVPVPKPITDDELLRLCEAEDPSGYRIPMSLGEPHAEIDNKGCGCTAYDVVVNPGMLLQLHDRNVLLGFFLTVVIEGLEYKYNISLDRNWKMLKNRKFVGSLPEQNIRTRSKPLIMEMEESNQPTGIRKPLISEATDCSTVSEPQRKGPVPPYTILAEPANGHPEFLVAEIHMPKVKAACSLTLDVGEDRLIVTTRSNVYHLDVFLPFDLVQEDCISQFNRNTQILTVTMPVVQPVS